MRSLTRWERQWAVAIWDGIFPPGVDARLPTGIRELDVEGFLTDLERSMPARWLWTFRVVVVMVALAPVVLFRRFATVAGIEPAARVRLLDRLGESRLYIVRQLGTVMKLTGGLLYCAAAPVRAAMARPEHGLRPSRVPTVVPSARLVRRPMTVGV